ncbi:MAG: 50S ribosomal protein L23 [Gammaproteobacteria bacterium]|nr:50S ribosomal protein L23 [Gammaproteobacteria bacterium]MDH5593085.1 50S ribosomal protein L23 [Gammaproteobacteria bacterium]MDH5613798.1 50S ribosomal protein L23 [Gammaproteobacteria bacterium]
MNQERLMKVVLAPHISEKSTIVADRNKQFVFKVIADATKPEIKKAVEMMFDVKVAGVQVINMPAKRKRFGQAEGQRSGWKKAYVKLQDGHDIDFMGAE